MWADAAYLFKEMQMFAAGRIQIHAMSHRAIGRLEPCTTTMTSDRLEHVLAKLWEFYTTSYLGTFRIRSLGKMYAIV